MRREVKSLRARVEADRKTDAEQRHRKRRRGRIKTASVVKKLGVHDKDQNPRWVEDSSSGIINNTAG